MMTGERAAKGTRLGKAISPFTISAITQTKSSLRKLSQSRNKEGPIEVGYKLTPNKNSKHRFRNKTIQAWSWSQSTSVRMMSDRTKDAQTYPESGTSAALAIQFSPETKSESPVKLQIIMVSIKVPVMEIKPCLTGSLVFAAAKHMGADPAPIHWRKTPRATPF